MKTTDIRMTEFNARQYFDHIYSQIIIKPIQWCNELFRTF